MSNDTVEQQLMAHDLALNAQKEHLRVAQDRMKKQADQSRRELEFEVGEEVFLKSRPYRQRSFARKRSEKLVPKFFGPWSLQDTQEDKGSSLQIGTPT